MKAPLIPAKVSHYPSPFNSPAGDNLPNDSDKEKYREDCYDRRRTGIYVVNPIVRWCHKNQNLGVILFAYVPPFQPLAQRNFMFT